MSKKLIVVLFLCFFIFGVGVYILIPKTKVIFVQNLIVEKDLSDLVIDSDIIIQGEVNRKFAPKWSNENFSRGYSITNIIQTDFEISINSILKGNPYNYDYIRVRTDSGKIDGTEYISTDSPKFIVGQDVILFLSDDDSDTATDEKYYILTGMGQGYFIKKPYTDNMYESFYNCKKLGIINELVITEMLCDVLNN